MRGSGKRMLSLLLAAIIFVVALVVFSNMVVPEYARINELRGEVASKQTVLDEQRLISDKLDSLLLQYQSVPLNSSLNLSIPDKENVAGAFQQALAVAKANGLLVQQFGVNTSGTVRPTREGAGTALRNIGTVQLNIHMLGSYEAFKAFVSAIERNVRIMDLSDIKIQPSGRIGDNSFVFSVIINAYYQA